jgi:hypothetical protein
MKIKQREVMSDSECELDEVMSTIHSCVEKLAHESKVIYAKALKIQALVECPELDIWTQEFHLDERAYKWAKHHMVPRKCSLWQVHKTLLESAKRDKRIGRGQVVRLLQEESEIMDLPSNHPISVWQVLGRLSKFFVQ